MNIIDAITNNNIDNLKLLINNNNINDKLSYNGDTALILACKKGDKNIVELLLEYNADVNVQDKHQLVFIFHNFISQ